MQNGCLPFPDHVLLEYLSGVNDNRRLVILESPPYQNATHDCTKSGYDRIDNWVFGELVSSAQCRASESISCFHDNLHTFHCESAENYFVVPRPRWSSERRKFGMVCDVNIMLYIHDSGQTDGYYYEVAFAYLS